MAREIVVISVAQAVEILKQHGMAIYPEHLRAGIECGAYPFGKAIKMQKHSVYEIYKPLLMRWIDERSEEVSA